MCHMTRLIKHQRRKPAVLQLMLLTSVIVLSYVIMHIRIVLVMQTMYVI